MNRHEKELRRKRRREKRMKRATALPAIPIPDAPARLRRFSYKINFGEMREERLGIREPSEVLDDEEQTRLHHETLRDPHAAIPKLERLIERHPDIPVFHNWLTVAYGRTGEAEKSRELARLNYERNPTYLFARLNYAQLCLYAGDVQRGEEIMEGKFDLKLLCPDRDEFHVSEFNAMCGVAIEYYLQTQKIEQAESMLETLMDVDPENEMAIALAKRVQGAVLIHTLRRLSVRSFGKRGVPSWD